MSKYNSFKGVSGFCLAKCLHTHLPRCSPRSGSVRSSNCIIGSVWPRSARNSLLRSKCELSNKEGALSVGLCNVNGVKMAVSGIAYWVEYSALSIVGWVWMGKGGVPDHAKSSIDKLAVSAFNFLRLQPLNFRALTCILSP